MAASTYSTTDSFAASLQGQIDAIKAAGAGGTGVDYQPQIDSIKASIPKPSEALPAGVADSSMMGSDPTKYATEGHVHASKVRKQRVAVSVTLYTWAYPTPFASGVAPICNAIAQCPVGTTDLINCQIDGAPTNTSCVIRITRYTQGVVGLINGVLAVNTTPLPGLILHLSALEP